MTTMNPLYQNDGYDSSLARSPGSLSQHQQMSTLPRASSRPQYDAFGSAQSQNGLHITGADDMTLRFENNRFNDRMGGGGAAAAPPAVGFAGAYNTYDMPLPPAWNSSGFPQNNHLAALGATTRGNPNALRPGRGSLPLWHEPPQNMQSAQLPVGGFGGGAMGMPPPPPPPMRPEQFASQDVEDDLIPTAIVIKNIPFAVKKEQLVQVMTEMGLPIPYAFNYHFDNGVFRGLAFANFTTPEETAAVINGMNHLDLQGRKLRVEYKKMLPQAERDRIEREKRERRGQLEEQHRPMPSNAQLQNQHSMSSLSSQVAAHSPSPNSARTMQPTLDMNDPTTLAYYAKLILFQGDPNQGDVLQFPTDLPSDHRTIIHGLAHTLGLWHASQGTGEQRSVHVYRHASAIHKFSPTLGGGGFPNVDAGRRPVVRSATTDFADVQRNDRSFYNASSAQTQSSGFLHYQESQNSLGVGQNLRSAKSVADLRSYTPSPAQSASSFPAGLTGNLNRFQEYGPPSPGSQRSNFTTPTTLAPNPDTLLNGMNNMNLGNPGALGPPSGSPHRPRGMVSWEREQPGASGVPQSSQQQSSQSGAGVVSMPGSGGPGPIGGHRFPGPVADDMTRNRPGGGSLRARTVVGPDHRAVVGPYSAGATHSGNRHSLHQSRASDDLAQGAPGATATADLSGS